MKPLRSPEYLKFLRSLPCSVPDCRRHFVRSEASHTGNRGLGQRASDWDAIPLCPRHHRQYHDVGRRSFEKMHGMSIRETLERLHRKPQMRLQAGEFVAMFDGEDYRLGPVSQGAEAALKKFKKIRLEMAG
jgi:hypothetical protein